MIDVTVENVRAVALPGKVRAELDLTNAKTHVRWGNGIVRYDTTGIYEVEPRVFNLIVKAMRYAQPRVQRALGHGRASVTLYVSEEGGNEKCRFVIN